MKRRNFIRNCSLLGAPFFVGGLPISSFSKSRFTQMFDPEDDRVLILIQLNGGNDGLNTIIPLDQYGNLFNLRANILIPENKIVKIEDHVGLHPSFSDVSYLYNENKLAVIQGVAYANQNRSHFRSLDIWQTGSDANEYLSSGWVGRYLDTQHNNYPSDYPNEDNPDPIAISIGFQLSETCQGLGSNYSIALSSESSLQSIGNTGFNEYEAVCYAEQVAFIQDSIAQLNAYSSVVNEAFEKGSNQVTYPETRFGEQLRLIAKLISGGLGTKIYVANLGGFDTHANQVEQNDATQGEHAELLAQLGSGILAFQKDMEAQNFSERVIGMTYSEFGRRIRSNGSFGSDHGTAAPMLVFGNCVRGGVFGTNPDLSGDISNSDGLPMQYDFRSVYASILMDWFGVEESQLREILYEEFTYVPIITECLTTNNLNPVINSRDISLYPNPSSDYVTINFDNPIFDTIIQIFNAAGGMMYQNSLPGYTTSYQLSIQDYPPGKYFVRIIQGKELSIKKLIKH